MAKITIAGNAMVVTSDYTTEQIKKLEKYLPKALVLVDAKTDEEVFKVGTAKSGNINKFGVSFDGVSRDGEAKACLTLQIPSDVEDAVKFVADNYGTALMYLNEVEAALPDALEDVEAQQAKILANITIA